MDYNALHSEINTDTTQMGYAALVTIGSDAGIASLLNMPSASRVSRQVVSRETFMVDFGPQVLTILSDTTLSANFGPLLKLLALVSTVDYSNALVAGALHNMIGVGGLTQTAISSLTTRPASRAEILFGIGIIVSGNDVSMALRGV